MAKTISKSQLDWALRKLNIAQSVLEEKVKRYSSTAHISKAERKQREEEMLLAHQYRNGMIQAFHSLGIHPKWDDDNENRFKFFIEGEN